MRTVLPAAKLSPRMTTSVEPMSSLTTTLGVTLSMTGDVVEVDEVEPEVEPEVEVVFGYAAPVEELATPTVGNVKPTELAVEVFAYAAPVEEFDWPTVGNEKLTVPVVAEDPFETVAPEEAVAEEAESLSVNFFELLSPPDVFTRTECWPLVTPRADAVQGAARSNAHSGTRDAGTRNVRLVPEESTAGRTAPPPKRTSVPETKPEPFSLTVSPIFPEDGDIEVSAGATAAADDWPTTVTLPEAQLPAAMTARVCSPTEPIASRPPATWKDRTALCVIGPK